MTDYMYNLSMSLLLHRTDCKDFKYVDLGSGTGVSAIHLVEKHSDVIAKATCLNMCQDQNITAKERGTELNLLDRIDIAEASFDETPCDSNAYDLAFSQDAFIHAWSKERLYAEAYRITKPVGALVFCDLMRGDNPDLTVQELAEFAQKNRINDWLNPSQNVKACTKVGWKDVKVSRIMIAVSSNINLLQQLC